MADSIRIEFEQFENPPTEEPDGFCNIDSNRTESHADTKRSSRTDRGDPIATGRIRSTARSGGTFRVRRRRHSRWFRCGRDSRGRRRVAESLRARLCTGRNDLLEWETIRAAASGDIAWFFTKGLVVATGAEGQKRLPYGLAGMLQWQSDRWMWRQLHGSEPGTA